jgi:hypothetical protein
LPEEELKESRGGLGLFCLSIGGANDGRIEVPVKEIVEHVEALHNLGYGVMLFRARELYTMSAYVNRYTKLRIHFAIGLTVLARVFEDRYKDLAGSLLEGIARLFTQNVRLSVYPMSAEDVQRRVKLAGLTGWTWKETNGMVTADNLHPSVPLDYHVHLQRRKGLLGTPPRRLSCFCGWIIPRNSADGNIAYSCAAARNLAGKLPSVTHFSNYAVIRPCGKDGTLALCE